MLLLWREAGKKPLYLGLIWPLSLSLSMQNTQFISNTKSKVGTLSATERQPYHCVSACPAGWIGFQGHCYHYVKPHTDWENARKQCSEHKVLHDFFISKLNISGTFKSLRKIVTSFEREKVWAILFIYSFMRICRITNRYFKGDRRLSCSFESFVVTLSQNIIYHIIYCCLTIVRRPTWSGSILPRKMSF